MKILQGVPRGHADPRLIKEMIELTDAESVVLVPMISRGRVLRSRQLRQP